MTVNLDFLIKVTMCFKNNPQTGLLTLVSLHCNYMNSYTFRRIPTKNNSFCCSLIPLIIVNSFHSQAPAPGL